jgi:hypothetical protein
VLPVDSVSSIPSFAIVGNDAALAARPATPVQLAHACLAVGFRMAIPASWGDELVAAESLRQLERHGREPAIHCACPHVAERLLAAGGELAPFLISLVAPPVAAARYLRSLYGRAAIRITYIGDCPGAADDAIDSRLLPSDFLDALARRGIVLADQPRVFDSVIPPDRRRYASLPGGIPAPDQLWNTQRRTLVALGGDGYSAELAQHLVASECVLVDLAPRLGCACSGAAGVPATTGRAAVAALEPPRAPRPPIDTTVDLQLATELPVLPASAPPAAAAPAAAAVPTGPARTGGTGGARPRHEERPGSPFRRRPTPTGFFRTPAGSVPQWRGGEGRALPRAYVGRRPTPVSLRAVPDASPAAPPAAAPAAAPAADARQPERPNEHANGGAEGRVAAHNGDESPRADASRADALGVAAGAPLTEMAVVEPMPAPAPVPNGHAPMGAEPPATVHADEGPASDPHASEQTAASTARPRAPSVSPPPVRLTTASALEAGARRTDARRHRMRIALLLIVALAIGAVLAVFAERLVGRRPAPAPGPSGVSAAGFRALLARSSLSAAPSGAALSEW